MEVALMMMVNRPPTCPNIIRLLDWTETASVYIMVIERPFFCQDLSDFMHSQGRTSGKVFFKQITEAVQYCHFKGVFHNDVKKENILVVTGTFQLKLIDFGCGYFLKDTEYSGHVGTIPYFAPERFLYNTFRAIPSTVWTLGVNLFEMVSGFLPFSSIDDILRNTPPFLFGISEAFEEYKIISNKTIEESIKGEFSSDVEDLLLVVVACIRNTPAFFAVRLHKSMKGAGTNETTLTRVMVSRSEIDLLDIRTEYKKLNGHSLYSTIKVRSLLLT
ncbi:PIM2 kinase, partial [Polypterus senegalus]|nr:PIM2 kinase [Polypterus senegalus]